MNRKPIDLTIVIPVKNEEKNLPGCLEAIGADFARNIVVIDSDSTDNTRAIARRLNAEVINFVWDGKFPKKRNWFLRNHRPKTKWVLFLDADEYLTDAFKSEIRKALISDDKVGYWLQYTVHFMGKKLRGGYPLKKLALFQVGSGEYERIHEEKWSNFDMEVHEHPVLQGRLGLIRNKIDHQDFRGVSHYANKHIEYAGWEARRFLILNTNDNKTDNKTEKWTWKQRLKYRLLNSILVGPAFFFGSFFLFGGFRDGARGLAFAIFKMAYFTQVYCHIREGKKN